MVIIANQTIHSYMRSFKQFFNEAAPPKPPIAPAIGKGARVTGKGLQLGQGADFTQMGYGYQPIQGPKSVSRWIQDYDVEQEKTNLKALVRAAEAFQAIYTALMSGDDDEAAQQKALFGPDIEAEGSVGNGAWIRNMVQAFGRGSGIMHRGIAKGHQFSASELEYLKGVGVFIPSVVGTPGEVCFDFNGDRLEELLKENKKRQILKYGGAQIYDTITSRATQNRHVSNQGTNLDINS